VFVAVVFLYEWCIITSLSLLAIVLLCAVSVWFLVTKVGGGDFGRKGHFVRDGERG
jgi:hypothetical protein